MEQEIPSKEKGNSKVLIIILILLALILAGATVYIIHQNSKMDEIEQEALIAEQQRLQDEYEDLTMSYEREKLNIRNDSLLHQFSNEQAKVQRLLEELKTVKATNRVEINRLNKELASLRKVLKSYIVQIDSLNKVNERLKQENREITTRYQQTTQTLNQVSQEKRDLSEKVTLAAKLDATGISVTPTNNKGKVQKKIKSTERLVVNFTITKNITAEPGERTIYVRIMKPDDDVLVKSRANVFPYENTEINYSIKRIIEYGGEEVSETLYWSVEEYLMPGVYRLDIFADGSRIGSKSFELKD